MRTPTVEMTEWCKIGKAVKLLGISGTCLRIWADQGKIKTIRTPGGHRLFDVTSIGKPTEEPLQSVDGDGIDIAYCRVSSHKQKSDLERQVAFMRERCPNATIITDVGSGINFKRKGLRSILEQTLQGHVRSLTIAHRDRLCRFGFELIQWLLERQHVRLVVLDNVATSPQHEFTEDLLAIVHVFSERFNGFKKYSKAAKKEVEGRKAKECNAADKDAKDSDCENDESSEEDSDELDGVGEVHIQQVPRSGQKRKFSIEPKPSSPKIRELDKVQV